MSVLPEGEETSVLGDYFDSRGMEIFKNGWLFYHFDAVFLYNFVKSCLFSRVFPKADVFRMFFCLIGGCFLVYAWQHWLTFWRSVLYLYKIIGIADISTLTALCNGKYLNLYKENDILWISVLLRNSYLWLVSLTICVQSTVEAVSRKQNFVKISLVVSYKSLMKI